jgi:RNA polymerase sigma-70 factor (ECF subfamily)
MQRIAVNTAIDYVRKQTPLTEELFENKIELEEETVEDEEDLSLSVEKIKNGIQQLAPGYRLILSLYLFEGYDMEEIAQILKVRPSTVRSQYMRGKNKLVELMKE